MFLSKRRSDTSLKGVSLTWIAALKADRHCAIDRVYVQRDQTDALKEPAEKHTGIFGTCRNPHL